ncbi:MAG: dephospho-CoA kinase [Hyphomicrobiales bacterium]
MIVAGLTGGIATGKSTVAAIFEKAGARIIDADRMAREAARKGSSVYRQIVAHFGKAILLADGEIDRKRLAGLIFADPAEQQALERIIHPQVKIETDRRLEQIRLETPGAVVIIDVPLLFEAGMDRGLDAVIVVYVPEKVQIQRLMDRDGLTKPEALARIRAQMPIDTKKSLATLVIDNTGDLDNTRAQTLEVYRKLVLQAGKQPR